MSSRKDIEWRLGNFARASTFDNCGIGPNGFEPGNTCGGHEGGGGSAPSKPSERVKGIEDRAKAAGKTFTDQWLEEQDVAINREHDARDRRRQQADERKRAKADEKVQGIERRLAELKARGPEVGPRAAEVGRSIEDIDKRIADIRKQREADSATAATAADERKKEAESDRAKRTEEVRKKWTKMFGPKKAEEMLAKVAEQVEQKRAKVETPAQVKKAPRKGSAPQREWHPEKKHNIALPKNPKRLNTDEADAALKQMGYSTSDTQWIPDEKGEFVGTKLLKYPDGKTERVNIKDIVSLVYAGQS
jgi:hypothetical protein